MTKNSRRRSPNSARDLALLRILEDEQVRRTMRNQLAGYRPYAKQSVFHAAGVAHRERLFLAGNQLGKTLAGASEVAFGLCRADAHAFIAQALNGAIEEGYLERDFGEQAVAAAEVVAALIGRPSQSLPPEVHAWVKDNGLMPGNDLQRLALVAVERVERDSELRELWQETDEFETWLALIRDLKIRLQTPHGSA